MSSGLFLVKGNPYLHLRAGESGQRHRRLTQEETELLGIGILLLANANGLFWRTDERVEVRATSCPQDRELSLKADEPQVGQRHEDVERNQEYYHIIVFPEWTYEVYDQVLDRIGEKRTLINNIIRRIINWIGHIRRRNCLLDYAIEG